MQVTSGLSFETPTTRWRKVVITLDDSDLVKEFGVERHAAMTLDERFVELNRLTRKYLVAELVGEGAMTKEQAKKQVGWS